MYICKKCATSLERPAGGLKAGILDRFADPKCERGHDLLHIPSFWGSGVRGFALSFMVMFATRALSLNSAFHSRALKFTASVGAMILAVLFLFFVARAMRYRRASEPFVRLWEPALGAAGGVALGLTLGLMALNISQMLLR